MMISILLSGCSMNEIPEKLIPKKADEFSKNYIDSLENGKTDYCFNKLDKQYQNEEAKAFYSISYENLKDKDLISSRIVNSQKRTIFFENTVTNYNLVYEYEYSGNLWVYYTFQLLEKENDFVVQTFSILPSDQSLSKIHEFTFENKSFINFLWIFLVIIIPIFILVTLIFAIRTPLKRKWLWIIFILFGFVAFSLNWTTGEIRFQLINFKLFGAGIVKSGIIAPWIVSFAIPIGAIVFWFKRNKIIFNEIKEENDDPTKKNIVHSADSAKNKDDSDK